jgi:hypothetical protein
VASAAAAPANALVRSRQLPAFAGRPGRRAGDVLAAAGTVYRGFGMPPEAPGISRAARFRAALKGALVTRLAHPGLCIVNTHPVANRDGD